MRTHFNVNSAILIASFVFSVVSVPARAQQYPRWETFTGFSYAHVNLGQQTATFHPTDKNYYGLEVTRTDDGLIGSFGCLLCSAPTFNTFRVAAQSLFSLSTRGSPVKTGPPLTTLSYTS